MGIFGRLFKPNVQKMEKKKNVEGLIKALKHEDSIVQLRAAKALGNLASLLAQIGDARAVGPLIQALEDEDGDVRSSAAYALGVIGDERAVEPLIQALNDTSIVRERHGIPIGVQGHVAWALTDIGKPAIEPLIRVIQQKSGDTQEKAIIILHDIMMDVSVYDGEPLYLTPLSEQIDRSKLERAGEPLIEALRRQDLQHDADTSDPRFIGLPRRIIKLLGDIRDERAVEPLIKILERGRHEKISEAAGSALGEIVPDLCRVGKLGPDIVARVVAALKEKEFKWDLGEIGIATGNAELLLIGLEEASTNVSVSSKGIKRYARALEKTGDKRAVKPLIEVATKFLEKSLEARQKGMEARSEEIEEMLLSAETTLGSIGMELANTAIRIDPEEAYSEALKCGDTWILKRASEALEKIRDKKRD